MLTRRNLIYVAIAGVILFTGVLASQAASGTAETRGPTGASSVQAASGTPSYARDVAPILDRSCVRCHGEERADKGLRLDSYRRALAGDSYGAVLIPGKSSLSAMVSVVKYGTMPHDSMRLPPEEIDTISRWIDAGAAEN